MSIQNYTMIKEEINILINQFESAGDYVGVGYGIEDYFSILGLFGIILWILAGYVVIRIWRARHRELMDSRSGSLTLSTNHDVAAGKNMQRMCITAFMYTVMTLFIYGALVGLANTTITFQGTTEEPFYNLAARFLIPLSIVFAIWDAYLGYTKFVDKQTDTKETLRASIKRAALIDTLVITGLMIATIYFTRTVVLTIAYNGFIIW